MLFKKSERELEEIRHGKRILGVFIMIAAVGILAMSVITAFEISWPKTEAVVVESVLEKAAKRKSSIPPERRRTTPKTTPPKPEYDLKVGYKYSVDNQEYEGRGTIRTSKNQEELQSKIRDDYPVGRKIQISYNPSDPTESRLYPATIVLSGIYFILSIAVAFGGFKLASLKQKEVIEPEDY